MKGAAGVLTFYVSWFTRLLLVLLMPLAFSIQTAQGQCKMSTAHEALQGLRNCSTCHKITGNVVNERCLECHTPLKRRIEAGQGYHATVADQNCGDCHQEHARPTPQLIRFDTTRFDHARTGFRLTGAHGQAACRTCHRASLIADADVRAFKGTHDALDRTFLGLGTECSNCHDFESPHGGQFAGRECTACHTTEAWEQVARFDHEATNFKLVGRHREVACTGCHPEETTSHGKPIRRFEGIAFATCASCHTDVHDATYGRRCASCHNPGDWHQIRNLDEDRFEHASALFDLVGRHLSLACSDCHTRPARADTAIQLAFVAGTEQHTYPKIQVEDCLSCHVDAHRRLFEDAEGGSDCANCHTQQAWLPITYDVERHNRETRFALTGAHLVAPCTICHHTDDQEPIFRFEDFECRSCHVPDNPHGTQFDDPTGVTACVLCHTAETWALASYDHTQNGFALRGRHADTECASCHKPSEEMGTLYRGLASDCRSCHHADDPHAGQFEDRNCDACHDTHVFAAAAGYFDHRQTRFPLEGAHRYAACERCHNEETTPDGDRWVRYRPLTFDCEDCHRTR